jgi:hypothetical protein
LKKANPRPAPAAACRPRSPPAEDR